MRKLILITSITVLLTAIISTSLSFLLFQHWSISQQTSDTPNHLPSQLVNQNNVNVKPSVLPDNFVASAKKVTPSIVSVVSSKGSVNESNGSGVIISTDGYIITNNHVIGKEKNCDITLWNKREYKARVIGSDKNTDLALIKIDAKNLPVLTNGNSDNVQVGEWVLAVGNPFKLASTVTAGIVRAKARGIDILQEEYSIESFIQTDAAVNPGNSGGALINAKGELVGINSAIITETGSFQGYSFAIPVNLALKVTNDIKKYGSVQRAILGVRILSVDDKIAQEQKLKEVKGVKILSVFPESTGAEAGLRQGDIIVKVNGQNTDSVPELQELVALMSPGDKISVEFVRKGKSYTKHNIKLRGLDDLEKSINPN